MLSEFNAMSDEERREFINQAYIVGTTEDATQTDLVGEQHDDGRVEAGKEEYSIIRIPYELINKPKSPPEG